MTITPIYILVTLLTQQRQYLPQSIPISALRTPFSMDQPTLYAGYGFSVNPVAKLEGLTLVNRNGVIVLRVTSNPSPAASLRIYNYRPVCSYDATNTTCQLPPSTNVTVHLNGLRQTPGIEFTITAQVLTFIPNYENLTLPGTVINLDYDPLP